MCIRDRGRGYAEVWQPGMRAGSRRQLLRDDLLEQLRFDFTVCERTYVRALLRQRCVAFIIQRWTAIACGPNPGSEPICRYRLHVEMHVRETIATVVARQTMERARRCLLYTSSAGMTYSTLSRQAKTTKVACAPNAAKPTIHQMCQISAKPMTVAKKAQMKPVGLFLGISMSV